jgi:hypothetical protein
MTTQNTKQINFNTKSQLAKLIASENITVQHNQVKTASFDTLNRILTLPIFKVQSGDVYDMLIAHECSHALWTPTDGWAKIADDNELRSYVNVLEDCRIDKKIQNKYPGVVRNYLNGFDIMNSQDFFGIKDKDIDNDLMLIDKINLYYKSSKRLPFSFAPEDKLWLSKVDNLKSFNDVVKLAKLLLNWQKKQIKKMKKLPGFDNHVLVENYKLSDKDSDNNVNKKDVKDSNKQDNESESSNDNEQGDNDGDSKSDDSGEKEDNTKTENKGSNPDGAGGEGGLKPGLTAITDKTYELAKESLLDTKTKFTYVNLPKPNLDKIIYSNKKWLETWREYRYQNVYGPRRRRTVYLNWLKNSFTKFKNDNKKTVMYLVKEFEMKKSATAYKRANTSKTGIIDPLKLSEYKYNDDIFKKLTILPDAKNHGMIMLLDWSGSMADVIKQTIDQLMNLVWFCQKINIPYEVYLFSTEIHTHNSGDRTYRTDINSGLWNYKHGDGVFDNFHLINVASHKMKKLQLDESLMYLYHLGLSYEGRYTRFDTNMSEDKGDEMDTPTQYYLGTTPLNESLVVMNKIVPMFKAKYNIEKLTFITLTDGASNSNYSIHTVENTENGLKPSNDDTGIPVIKIGKKQYSMGERELYGNVTPLLLKVLKEEHGINIIGFFLAKRLRAWDMDRYVDRKKFKTWQQRHDQLQKLKSQFSKEKCAIVNKDGYNKYFVINGKTMKVENTDLSAVNDGMKSASIKRLFSKSMKGRIISRTLLNKFIEEVA